MRQSSPSYAAPLERGGDGARRTAIALTTAAWALYALDYDLSPIMLGTGAGAMQRIAAPMFRQILGAAVLALAVVPALFLLWHRRSGRPR